MICAKYTLYDTTGFSHTFDMERFATHLERMSSAPLWGLRFLLLCLLAFASSASFAQEDRTVDVELVLAVDVSWSMDFEEQLIQRQGYSQAFRSEEVIDAILYGGYGRVAVTYLEWAGSESQEVVVPWTLIDSAEAPTPSPIRSKRDRRGISGVRRCRARSASPLPSSTRTTMTASAA
jgi:hypothetical protein